MTGRVDGTGAVRLRVDRTACTAHGLCADWLPEVVALDEWGYPVVAGPLAPAQVEDARRAAAECPVRALRVLGRG